MAGARVDADELTLGAKVEVVFPWDEKVWDDINDAGTTQQSVEELEERFQSQMAIVERVGATSAYVRLEREETETLCVGFSNLRMIDDAMDTNSRGGEGGGSDGGGDGGGDGDSGPIKRTTRADMAPERDEAAEPLHRQGFDVLKAAIPVEPELVRTIRSAKYETHGLPSGPDPDGPHDPRRQQTIDKGGAGRSGTRSCGGV